MQTPTQEICQNIVKNSIYMNASYLVEDLLEHKLIQWDKVENYFYPKQGVIEDGIIEEGEEYDDQDPKEVFEWYFVDKWLYKELAEQNSVLVDSKYGYIWGRETTGQAISMDTCIETIACKLQPANKES